LTKENILITNQIVCFLNMLLLFGVYWDLDNIHTPDIGRTLINTLFGLYWYERFF